MAQQRYALMKTQGTFMKSQSIDHDIVAMKAKMGQLKGKLALSKNLEQAGTGKTGEGTNKQHQKKSNHGRRCLPRQANHPPNGSKTRTSIGANTTWLGLFIDQWIAG